LMEKGSEMVKEKTYGIALLEGMVQRMESTREELLDILRRIYLEHKEVIMKYLSPTSLYIAYMTKTMVFTGLSNLSKKKMQSEQK